ncbi:MAG: rhodanese-like domain-containing protein [Planctomycetaceae bacterium]|nr:rhodanese-like domain-containing protein [Planctomycetaceae bacterium]MBT6485982.1 rhodanese-like domain-containing protein [Planctomycetaceae bacterium]MBT6494169.1 rhodanese-like domain-containing protein [Planctomycetaceae bacterium]
MRFYRCATTALLLSAIAATLRFVVPMMAGDGEAPVLKIEKMYRDYRREFRDVPDVTAAELRSLLENGEVLVVDVRDANERDVSTIPGAITVKEFERDHSDSRDASVVTYCTIGYRSGLFADQLRQRGVTVLNLSGGILAWSHAGGQLVTPTGDPTKRVHVYGRRWNLLPTDYDAVW